MNLNDIDITHQRYIDSAYSAELRERRALDKKLDADRPKCRICGGRLDTAIMIMRCPGCGYREGMEKDG